MSNWNTFQCSLDQINNCSAISKQNGGLPMVTMFASFKNRVYISLHC